MVNLPTIVLVHGAWGDGSCWAGVITILKNEGYNVIATQHALTGLAGDAETVRRVVEMQEGTVLLAGHSYGGAVITEAAGKCPNVTGLVYIAAFAPAEGESLGGLAQQAEQVTGNAAIRPDNYGNLWLDKGLFKESFCQEVDELQANIMAAVQKPIAIQCFTDAVTTAGWKNLPCWYQLSENDKMIAPSLEKMMAERIQPKQLITLPAGHASMVSFPKEVAALIMQAAAHI